MWDEALLRHLVTASLAFAGCDRASDDASSKSEDDFRQTFVPRPDVGGGTDYECDRFIQNCPAGEKCVVWASDGGTELNATRCTPVAANPRAVGMPCTVEGAELSGIDDCERGAMCLSVDPETFERTCYAMLTGSAERPVCADPMDTPVIPAGPPALLCVPSCRPLENDCPPGQSCHASSKLFACVPDASGNGGGLGDGCSSLNDCDPGMSCIDAEELTDCDGIACCSPHCDTNRPVCPDGLTCQPWSGDAPLLPGGESLGICLG